MRINLAKEMIKGGSAPVPTENPSSDPSTIRSPLLDTSVNSGTQQMTSPYKNLMNAVDLSEFRKQIKLKAEKQSPQISAR